MTDEIYIRFIGQIIKHAIHDYVKYNKDVRKRTRRIEVLQRKRRRTYAERVELTTKKKDQQIFLSAKNYLFNDNWLALTLKVYLLDDEINIRYIRKIARKSQNPQIFDII